MGQGKSSTIMIATENMFDGTFLQIPRDFLEQAGWEAQTKFVENYNPRRTEMSMRPTDQESVSTLELTMWKCFFKLSEKKYLYRLLRNSIFNKDSEKITRIFYYNTEILKEIERYQIKFSLRKDLKFDETGQFLLENLNFEKLGMKCMKKNQELLKTRQETPNNPIERKSDEKHLNVLNSTNHDAERGSTEEPVAKHRLVSSEPSTSSNRDRQLTTKDTNSSVQKPKKDKGKAAKDLKEFDLIMKSLVKKDKKEQDEIDKALEKENIRLDFLIRKKSEETETMSRKLNEMEEQMDKERKERSEKSEEEFRRKLEEQKKEQEEVLRKIREKREEMEREMDRIHEETLKAIYMKQQVFWKCVELKTKWEEKENEWTDYLKRLRTSVARTKIQYMTFQRETRNYSEGNEFEKKLIEFELDTLQRKTLQSYDLLYQSFIFIKNLANNFPDRVFILILLKNLKHVTDKVCKAAMTIDKVRENLANRLVLGNFFGPLDSHEILQTWNLKELSKTARMEYYEKIEDPLIYEYQSSGAPTIVEMEQENEEPDGKRSLFPATQLSFGRRRAKK